MLANVFNDTLKHCKENSLTNLKTAKVKDDVHLASVNKSHLTFVQVKNLDCVEVARELVLLGRTCMLNMANATNRGGGVERGAMAQEEELCRRSNLWYGLRPSYYPMVRDEFVYTKNVKFFKNQYYLYSDMFKCDILTIAAPCLIGLDTLPKNYAKTVESKIKHMLTYPATIGVQNLVLSAFGCGAFRNDPTYIANVFKKHLKGLPYKMITFAVLDTKNEGNFEVFRDILKDV